MVCSGIVANTDYVKANADLVKRFMSATTKAVEAAEKDPKGAAQSILDANPKGGKIDTLTQGFELTIPLYRTSETKAKRPFQVTDQNMTDTVNLLVEYGGLDAQGQGKNHPRRFIPTTICRKAIPERAGHTMFRCDAINPPPSCPASSGASSTPDCQFVSTMLATEYWIARSSRARTRGDTVGRNGNLF